MAKKTVTLILLRADRKLWDGGSLRLKVTNVVHSELKVLHNEPTGANTSTILLNLDLLFDAGQVYGISVEAEDHRTAWQLINRRSFIRQEGGHEIEVKDIFMRLMLVPKKPSSSDLGEGWTRLRERASQMVADDTGLTEGQYLALKPAEKMTLLNIEAKLRETRLNGMQLLSFVEAVQLVAVDRLFLLVGSQLKAIIDDSSEFAPAPGHKAPKNMTLKLPSHPDSWKHRRFGAGNLQLSFSKTAMPLPGNPGKPVFSIDADIDLEKGLGHAFEWLDNNALHPDKKTDQTLVYALLFSQGIIPEYTLDLLSADK